MRITKSQLRQIIKEELTDFYGTQDAYSIPKQQKRNPVSKSVNDERKEFIDSVIDHKFKALEHKERQSLIQKLSMSIDKAIAGVLEKFTPTPLDQLQEEAPPGMEDKVKALKKKLCDGKDDCPQAFATAWKQHNKGK
jgi:hypothetical protein